MTGFPRLSAPVSTSGTVALLLVLFLAAASLAAENSVSSAGERADSLAQAGHWQEAAEAYWAITESEPDNAISWSKLGGALYELKRYGDAAEAWMQADALSFSPARTRYNLARAHAAAGEAEEALRWLEGAIDAGFQDVRALSAETAFEALRNDERFSQLEQLAERKAFPCKHQAEAKQFDFWIGEWDVFDSHGNQVGSNSIRKELGGCMLVEHWSGNGGSEGKSINFYDAAQERWEETWIDKGGGIIRMVGMMKGGAMVLEGNHLYRDGRRELIRGTWTLLEDGRVRQLFEQSRNGGESWYTWFEGYYVKKS